MRHLAKAESPAAFEDWKASGNADWQPSYDTLQNLFKSALHQSLMSEQGYVCCYCGRSITRDDSHIEHFRPQQSHEELALDYQNLHASCIRESKPGTPLHCGHAKGSQFDETLHISPTDRQCETRFVFRGDGQIAPTSAADTSASYMIDLLRLDVVTLRNRRQEVIRQVFDPAFLEAATVDELRRLATQFRALDEDGGAIGFGHVVARFAERLIPGSTPP